MINSNTKSPEQGQVVKGDRWYRFLLVAMLAQGVAFFGCLEVVEPPRIPGKLVRLAVALVACATPIVASLCLLFRQRKLSERIVGYSSLAFSVFWLVFAGWVVKQALRDP